MIRLALIAALLAAPALAATVEDPDSPRFADGLRVLGMRGEVKIERVLEVESIDREPLYLARTPAREAFFRAGEDMCMANGKLGHFVACDARLAQAAARTIGDPIRGAGITVWPGPPRTTDFTVPPTGGPGGGGWVWTTPAIVAPPEPPPFVAPVPLGGALGNLLMGMLTALGIVWAVGKLEDNAAGSGWAGHNGGTP